MDEQTIRKTPPWVVVIGKLGHPPGGDENIVQSTGWGSQRDLYQDALERMAQSRWVVLRLHDLSNRRSRQANEDGRYAVDDFERAILVQMGGQVDHDESNKRPLAERLIVVIEASSFRKAGFKVSEGLSWESSALDVLLAVARDSTLKLFQWIVVTFGAAGALLVTRTHPETLPTARLYFDATSIEGQWERERAKDSHQDEFKGRMIGYTYIVTASIAVGLTVGRSEPPYGKTRDEAKDVIGTAIKKSLSRIRNAEEKGFSASVDEDDAPVLQLTYPDCMRFDEESGFKPGEAEIEYPALGIDPTRWSILSTNAAGPDTAYRIAKDIVLSHASTAQGQRVPVDIPCVKFGNLITVDRAEMEALRALHIKVAEYLRDVRRQRPMSIAVFGAPGDGKSFAVKELVNHVSGDTSAALKFNLSQFGSESDLIDALHQVQDGVSHGNVPLVFWDEFDTQFKGEALGWLRFFLSPMEDGTFRERDTTHPVGRAVFVFAGGTSISYRKFMEKAESPEHEHAKGIDFISRLGGYLNITGPNPPRGESVGSSKLIYRAILLRTALDLQQHRDGVDEGVILAFLTVSEYRHGSRSLQKIVEMSSIRKDAPFGVSSLPPETQLDLHVDAKDFIKIALGPL